MLYHRGGVCICTRAAPSARLASPTPVSLPVRSTAICMKYLTRRQEGEEGGGGELTTKCDGFGSAQVRGWKASSSWGSSPAHRPSINLQLFRASPTRTDRAWWCAVWWGNSGAPGLLRCKLQKRARITTVIQRGALTGEEIQLAHSVQSPPHR